MVGAVGDRAFKERLYAQFARVGAALASERRLELIDLLAQAPRHVEALAAEMELPIANTSQHLRALHAARLVESERQGTKVVYRLADDGVLRLWLALRATAESRLAEVPAVVRDFGGDASSERITRDDLDRGLRSGRYVVLDVRPEIEYAHGHLPGAINIPVALLADKIGELQRDKRIVVYCRGTYCQFAGQALEILRSGGFDAIALDGGWQEWRAEERPAAAAG